ncbi:MAG: extracellular solute-binding protein [Candidatus Moranbacteria bacterium]|nr:extracellular solute-binding protein [Candidatus Moranbacteria bacterium]
MKKEIKTILLVFFVFGTLLVSGCGCKQSSNNYRMNLEVWGFLDDREALSAVFDNYKKINKNIAGITYRKLSTDTYKKELIEALASGQGPDIFMISNSWLPSFQNKLVSAPADIFNEQTYRNNFVDTASDDFISQGSIWAAPLSVDSLGLYYNKDMFNVAGITSPPKTWNEFLSDVKLLTRVDSDGEITQSGVAMGTAYNINRSTDLLGMLMLQSGTKMSNEDLQVTFNSDNGRNALNFYTQFAKSASPTYSWNPKMHYSIDAFSEGKTAMMFNYSWHIQTIRSKSPKLNFAVAKIPQFSESAPVNYSNYWAMTVAKNKIASVPSGNPAVSNDIRVKEAWKFIRYLTAKPDGTLAAADQSIGSVTDKNFDPAATYLEKDKSPAARKDLIEAQKTDPDLGAFAWGNLIARNWKQADPESVELIMSEMIDQVNKGNAGVDEAINAAVSKINKSISK